MKKGKINIVIDGQWGSTGKGKIVGYLAKKHKIDASVCNFMTNAGHTFVDDNGNSIMFQHIPVSAVNPNIKLFLAPSSAITLDIFWKEVKACEKFGTPVDGRLKIDPNAIIIQPRHANIEASEIKYIASTMKGCGYALAEKIQRKEGVILAKNCNALKGWVAEEPIAFELNEILRNGGTVIGETAQGFDLSLNHGHIYPFVTSRDVTVMQFLNDCGIHPQYLGDTYGVIRTFPIRVGNVYDEKDNSMRGYSGHFYGDHHELDWDFISEISGKSVKELTTVTKRVRRVFSFSNTQYKKFLLINRPDIIAINFVNYFNGIDGTANIRTLSGNQSFVQFVDRLEAINKYFKEFHGLDVKIGLFGTGAKNNEIVDTRMLDKG